jgi:hypothetical protein
MEKVQLTFMLPLTGGKTQESFHLFSNYISQFHGPPEWMDKVTQTKDHAFKIGVAAGMEIALTACSLACMN